MTDVPSPPPNAPTAARPGARLASLDLVRGVAVIGILFMNIHGFALPLAAYANPAALGPPSDAALAVWAAEFIAIDGKMRGLFTLLFGASAFLVMDRAEAAGRDPAIVHARRLVWLFAFGLVHFYGLWSGDILIEYAAVGLLLPAFRPLGPRALAAIAALALAWHLALDLPGAFAAPTVPDFYRSAFGIDPATVAADLQLYRSSYGTIFADRLAEQGWWPLYAVTDNWLEDLALMLSGAALLRLGLFAGRFAPKRLLWLSLPLLALGFAGNALLADWQWRGGFDGWDVYRALTVFALPFDFVATLGWALLLTAWGMGRTTALKARLAAAGRMAFSNYLATSLVMTSLFYGYGLGLFGRFDRPALLGFVLLMAAAMLGWSKPWLDRFHYGPLEWLWRSLARGARQPMRRAPELG